MYTSASVKNECFFLMASDAISVCELCGLGEDDSVLAHCVQCGTCVHLDCYGTAELHPEHWHCSPCAHRHASAGASCVFCPVKHGALKPCDRLPPQPGSRWAHWLCALWLPGVAFLDVHSLEPVTEVDEVLSKHGGNTCEECNLDVGACCECSIDGCSATFHVTCAKSARHHFRHEAGILCARHSRLAVPLHPTTPEGTVLLPSATVGQDQLVPRVLGALRERGVTQQWLCTQLSLGPSQLSMWIHLRDALPARQKKAYSAALEQWCRCPSFTISDPSLTFTKANQVPAQAIQLPVVRWTIPSTISPTGQPSSPGSSRVDSVHPDAAPPVSLPKRRRIAHGAANEAAGSVATVGASGMASLVASCGASVHTGTTAVSGSGGPGSEPGASWPDASPHTQVLYSMVLSALRRFEPSDGNLALVLSETALCASGSQPPSLGSIVTRLEAAAYATVDELHDDLDSFAGALGCGRWQSLAAAARAGVHGQAHSGGGHCRLVRVGCARCLVWLWVA
jgi:hypothetical protein